MSSSRQSGIYSSPTVASRAFSFCVERDPAEDEAGLLVGSEPEHRPDLVVAQST